MPIASLLFDQRQVFLGEVMTRDGAFERVLLNAEGERKIGPHLTDWQTRGIPVTREVMQRGDVDVFFQERVPVRSHEFFTAFDRWVALHGLVMVTIKSEDVSTWEGMVRLPLDDKERFSMLVAMRNASDEMHASWRDGVAAAGKAMETKDPSAKKKLLELKKMTAGGLMKKLQEA